MSWRLVTPEAWYRGFWLLWTILAFIAARLWLVNPIVHAIEQIKK